MKNVSLILNVVLFLLVAVLYYYHFKVPANQNIVVQQTSKDSLILKPLKVAYVDLDTIEEKFAYFKQKQTEYDKRREEVDKQLNTEYENLEKERYQFAQRGAAITQTEADAFQKEYAARMQDLQHEKEQKDQQFIEERQRNEEDVQGKINMFLEEYNKTKRYSFIFSMGKGTGALFYEDTTYNITAEVLAGLNANIKVSPN